MPVNREGDDRARGPGYPRPMAVQALWRRQSVPPIAADAALAVVLIAVQTLTNLAAPPSELALGAPAMLPVLVRRRFPLGAALGMAVAIALGEIFTDPHEDEF